MICHRCNEEAWDEIEVPGLGWVCHEHLLVEDRQLIDFAHDQELAELEASYEASLERVRRMRAGIVGRRLKAALARRGSGGWGE